MGFPRKINRMRIIIDQLSLSRTVKDSDFREQVGKKFRTTRITVEGQVNLAKKKQYFASTPSRTGDIEDTMGHLVFIKKELDTAGITLRKGDKIVEVGPATNPTPIGSVIEEVRPESPLNGDFLLIYVDFKWDVEERGSLVR